jgi:hypothetical protein
MHGGRLADNAKTAIARLKIGRSTLYRKLEEDGRITNSE